MHNASANFIEKSVPLSSLSEYSVIEPIKQTFKGGGGDMREDGLLETYNVV